LAVVVGGELSRIGSGCWRGAITNWKWLLEGSYHELAVVVGGELSQIGSGCWRSYHELAAVVRGEKTPLTLG